MTIANGARPESGRYTGAAPRQLQQWCVELEPRFHYWIPRGKRRPRVLCPNGHEFTPDMTLRAGACDVPCLRRNGLGEPPCGRTLYMLLVPDHHEILVAEVSAADLEQLEQFKHAQTVMTYLLRSPKR
jgi:hypothetical protein